MGTANSIAIKTKGGHQIVLDDTSSANSITIKTQGSQQLVLDDAAQSIKLQGGGRSIEMVGGVVKIT